MSKDIMNIVKMKLTFYVICVYLLFKKIYIYISVDFMGRANHMYKKNMLQYKATMWRAAKILYEKSAWKWFLTRTLVCYLKQ